MRTSRRTFLRSAGAAVALPWLESLAGADDAQPPTRLFLYVVGGGMYLPAWTLDDAGRRELLAPPASVEWLGVSAERNEPLGKLSPTLAPLEPHKKDLLVLGGLTLADAFGFEDGHSAEVGALLTCVPYARDRVHAGLSVDQVAARHFEGKTDFGALVLGLNGPRPGGAKGVGRIYAQHYSWRSATTPTGEERNPKLVFDRLFRRGAGGAGTDAADRRSVLDHVNGEAKRLRGGLSGADRGKLDEYLSAVRDVELRLERASRTSPDPAAPAFDAGEAEGLARRLPAEKGIPEDYVEYDRLMVDLAALALRSDLTRVVLLTHGGYRSYPEVGVKRGHHDLQHHEGLLEKRQELEKVDRFNMERFADVVARLKAIREGDGTLLDRSMVAYLSGMSNGNRHSRENLPVLVAGRANGTLKPGRYVDYAWKRKTPLANLYVEMLSRLGVPAARFGDSTGGLPGLA
ncbi:MAG TPA: DUF1552 domain-containing protein [Planctomycetota bacterium]|nr:DUF1552 domain-containing protein [Planctomycetota bacterium]